MEMAIGLMALPVMLVFLGIGYQFWKRQKPRNKEPPKSAESRS